MSFSLHPQLIKDCIYLGETELCQVLLLNDSQFPWLVLVPKHDNVSEIFQLEREDQLKLALETNQIGQKMLEHCGGDKLNIGALGNMVPQLHIHIIVRFKGDPAWPKPTWGNTSPKPYAADVIEGICKQYRAILFETLLA